MIHTIAVDPGCLDTWDRFQRFLAGCGPDRGRVLLEWPGSYRRHLREAIVRWPDRQRQRAEELFKRAEAGRRFHRRPGATRYDDKADWVTNALAEDKREKLRAVIAAEGRPGVVAVDDATDDAEPFRVPRTRIVRRTAADLADAVAPVLRLGGAAVHLVDPYLVQSKWDGSAWASGKHLEVLRHMLARGGGYANHVHWHARRHDGFDFAREEPFIRRQLPADLPNLAFTLWLWPDRALHNRFVLTEFAGVQFGHGLDPDRRDDEWAEDDLTLLDADHWRQRWEQFTNAGRRSDVVGLPVRTGRELRRGEVRGAAGSSLNISMPDHR